jgi:hypothetical protein
MSFKIANLLQFYMLTMQRTIGEEAILCQTLKEFVYINPHTTSTDGISPELRMSRTKLSSTPLQHKGGHYCGLH